MKIKFVLSNFFGFWKISQIISKLEYKNYLNLIDELITSYERKYLKYVEIHFLSNALTEKKDVQKHSEYIHSVNRDLFLDSGGLQIVTLGLQEKKEELKNDVYHIQAKHGTYNFSFDEIPKIESNPDKQRYNTLDQSSFIAIKEWYAPYGAKAGENLKNQLQVFKSYKAKGKIIPILQLLTEKETEDYAKGLFKYVKEDDKDFLYGIAIGGSDQTQLIAPLVSIYVLHNTQNKFVKQLQKQMIHFLGVASYNRILPIIEMYKKGLVDTEILSFDSSAYTKSYSFGILYHYENKNLETVKGLKKYTKVIDRISKNLWREFKDILLKYKIYQNFEELLEYSCFGEKGQFFSQNNINKNLEKYSKDELLKYGVHFMLFSLYNILNICRLIEDLFEDKIKVNSLLKNKRKLNEIHMIKSIKNIEDLKKTIDLLYEPNLIILESEEQLKQYLNKTKNYLNNYF